MLYTTEEGVASLSRDNHSDKAKKAVDHIEKGIIGLDKYYEHLTIADHTRIRAMAGRLMAMVEDE